MTSDDPIKNLIAAAEKMDKWLFQTCRASRFRRLVSHGLPAQELHDALATVAGTNNVQIGSKIPPVVYGRIISEINAAIKHPRISGLVAVDRINDCSINIFEDDDE